MMTSRRRHNRAPLRRSSAPEKFLAGGLAVAVCAGIIGVIGYRSIQEDAESSAETTDVVAPSAQPGGVGSDEAATVVSTEGLTREQLDDYAEALAAEKHRLDVYRVELIRVAKELQGASETSVSTSTVPEQPSAGDTGAEDESAGADG